MPNPILIAKNAQTELALLPALANRHGCITGATGTGKTVTLQVLAESFSRIGTPVFMADVKGDLTGVSQAGAASPKLQERLKSLGLAEPAWAASPVALWDVFGEQGAPVRATISDMGPLLLARILELNDTQEGVLALVFKVADDEGQLLLDLKDLRAMLQNVADRSAELKTRYGNVSAASVGAIQRSLLTLESQGAEKFFGEPMLDVADLMRTDAQGRGIVNVLAADKLMQAPRLYAIFLLWLLGDLYEKLPEVGDMEQPKLVFFFDEAHLLFTDAPQALLTKIEQVVRLCPLQGRRGVFRHPEPAGYSRHGAGAAGQPRPARAARLHAARPEGRQDGGADHASQSRAGYRGRHHRTGRRRGPGVLAGRQGAAAAHRARLDRAAGQSHRAGHGCRAPGVATGQSLVGQVRAGDRPRIRL